MATFDLQKRNPWVDVPVIRKGGEGFVDSFVGTMAEISGANALSNWMLDKGLASQFDPDPDYDFSTDSRLVGLPWHKKMEFEGSRSREHTSLMMRRENIRRDQERDNMINIPGAILGTVAGVAGDPLNYLIPGMVAGKFVKSAAVGAGVGGLMELPFVLDDRDYDATTGWLSVAATSAVSGLSGKFVRGVNRNSAFYSANGIPNEVVAEAAKGKAARDAADAARPDGGRSQRAEERAAQAAAQQRQAASEAGESTLEADAAAAGVSREELNARIEAEVGARSAANPDQPIEDILADVRTILAKEYDGSLGAAVNPAADIPAPRTYLEELWDNTLAATGVGAQLLGYNPTMRLLNSKVLGARHLVRDMVEDGGMIFNEYRMGKTSARSSVENNFRTNWVGHEEGAIAMITEQNRLYGQYRDAGKGVNALQDNWNILKKDVDDFASGNRGKNRTFLTRGEFREEIGKAMRAGDTHEIPEVQAAAKNWRKLLDRLKKDGNEVDLWTAELRFKAERIEAKARLEGRPLSKAETERLQAIDTDVKLMRERMNMDPLETGESHFPRIMKIDRIEAERAAFTTDVVIPYFIRRGMRMEEASIEADRLINDILHTPEHAHIGPDDLPPVGGARERKWDITDRELAGWLEDDVESVMRYYHRTVGTDIELSRQFGSYTMKAQIADIEAEWIERIRLEPENAAKLTKEMEANLRDVRALRDRLRGTYGQAKDPYRPLSRFYRVTKGLSTLAFMGGVTISSLPDIVRPVMVEGFERSFRDGLEPLFSATGRAARRMLADEARLAGAGGEIEMSITAAQLADISDVAGRRFPVERFIGKLTDKMFLINGLNAWNHMLKEWSGTIVSARILETSLEWSAGTITDANRTKLLRSNIDEDMAKRIAQHFDTHGETSSGVMLPNTASWVLENGDVDREAVNAFRGAISNDVNRIIVTPGVGDKALWTSTEWGSVISQFKTYGQSAVSRVLVSGLQERDAAFFMGAAMLIGMGHVTNVLKQSQYGYDPNNGFTEDLVDAVDRSGVLGFFMDANNALERITDYNVGLGPLLGTSPQSSTTTSKVGAVAGAGASLYMNLFDSMSQLAQGTGNQNDSKRLRSSLAFNNVPWLAPMFQGLEDGVIDPMMSRNTPRALFDDVPGGDKSPWLR